jgi:hypothetical protein
MSDNSKVAEGAAEQRQRNVLGQKARTQAEERAAWTRRINRWAKNSAAAMSSLGMDGPAETAALVKALAKAL